jgi:uncharacterized membrane protein YeaQ/YmgE (transglycosylase-associated protein family)
MSLHPIGIPAYWRDIAPTAFCSRPKVASQGVVRAGVLRAGPDLAIQPLNHHEWNNRLSGWLIVGGILGWVASIVMKTDGQQGIILNVVVGIVGALIAGFVIAPMFGTGTINTNDFSIAGLAVSFAGAVVLLAIVNLFRRGSTLRSTSVRPSARSTSRLRAG